MEYLSVYEYAERYERSHTTIYRAIRDGIIPSEYVTSIGGVVAIQAGFRMPPKMKPGRPPLSQRKQPENQQVSN